MGKTLIFAVYDFDRFSKHDEIGEVSILACLSVCLYSKNVKKKLFGNFYDPRVGLY